MPAKVRHPAARGRKVLVLSFGLLLLAGWVTGKESVAATAWLAVACIAYSLSDLNIARLVGVLGPPFSVHATILAVCLSYLLCGIAGLACLPWLGRGIRDMDWRFALPFSFCWFVGMCFLFGCFGSIGAVYGNILQSTRGIISVLIGAYLARLGLERLEQRITARTLARRVAAAVLMCVAIWLFRR